MPCKLLIKMTDNTLEDLEKSAISCYKRGDVVLVAEIADEIGSGIGLPGWGIITITDATKSEVITAFSRIEKSWTIDLDWTLDSHNAVLDKYEATLFSESDHSSSDLGNLTLGMVDTFLSKWNVQIGSNTTNSVSIHFYISNNIYKSESILFSKAFWNADVSNIIFSENSYNPDTGTHIIDLDYSNTNIKPLAVVRKIEEVGGTVMASVTGGVRFIINRNIVTSALKDSLIEAVKTLNSVRRRRMYFQESDLIILENNQGTISVNKVTLANKIQDKIT